MNHPVPEGVAWPEDADQDCPQQVGPLLYPSGYDLERNEVLVHDIEVNLDCGWQRDDPESADWQCVWGRIFIDERAFRIWLPEGTPCRLNTW